MKGALNKLADDVNSFIDEQSERERFSHTLKQTMERQILDILETMQDESQGKDREIVKPLTELQELWKIVS